MTVNILIDVVGWVGSLAVVSAYALLAGHRLDSKSRLYHLLNLVGGVTLVVNTVYYGAFPSTFVNLVWAVIAVTALARVRGRDFGGADEPTPAEASREPRQ